MDFSALWQEHKTFCQQHLPRVWELLEKAERMEWEAYARQEPPFPYGESQEGLYQWVGEQLLALRQARAINDVNGIRGLMQEIRERIKVDTYEEVRLADGASIQILRPKKVLYMHILYMLQMLEASELQKRDLSQGEIKSLRSSLVYTYSMLPETAGP